MKKEILLTGLTCNHCATYYFTKAETHKTECPECGYINEVFMCTSNLTDEEYDMLRDVVNEIKGVFIRHNIEHSNIDLFNYVDKVFNTDIMEVIK